MVSKRRKDFTHLKYSDFRILIHANGLQQIFTTVMNRLNESFALSVHQTLEFNAGFLRVNN